MFISNIKKKKIFKVCGISLKLKLKKKGFGFDYYFKVLIIIKPVFLTKENISFVNPLLSNYSFKYSSSICDLKMISFQQISAKVRKN